MNDAPEPDGMDWHAGSGLTSTDERAGGGGLVADTYLETVSRFMAADRQHRDILYERASVAAALKSSAHYRLELALLKVLPGHDGYNPQTAERLLRSVLEDPGKLPAGAVDLAGAYLRLVEEQNRLRSVNERLSQELKEANSKLDQLTRIEQSVDPPDDELLNEPPQGEQTNEQ